jgi:CheY-like chemotaxis protein
VNKTAVLAGKKDGDIMSDDKAKKLEILVVDDSDVHRNAASILLADHNPTIVDSFDSANDVLVGKYDWETRTTYKKEFNVVLTDLLFPQGRGAMQGYEGLMLKNEPMAFGFPLVLIAARQGVKHIAIVTDMNHHQHPMAYTFDFFKKMSEKHKEIERLNINGSVCMMFDERDLPKLYPMKDGTLTDNDPYLISDEKQLDNYITKKVYASGTEDFLYTKNWAAALDALLKKS